MRKLKKLWPVCLLALCILAGLVFLRRDGGAQEETAAEEEPTKIVIMMERTTEILDDLDMVTAAINDYIRPLVSAEVEFLFVDTASYDRTIGYKFSADEPIDILFEPALGGLEGLRRQGKLIPLDGLLEEYGQGILENLVEEEMVLGRIGGQFYGITTNRNKGFVFGVRYRKDIAEKYGIDVSQIKEMEDLTPVFREIKEKNPEAFPVLTSSYTRTWDMLGMDYLPFGVLMDYGQSEEVVNLYETEEYETYVRLLYQWNQEGYMLDGSRYGADDAHTFFRSGNAFCFFDTDSPEMGERESRLLGAPVGYLAFSPAFTSSIDLTYAFWGITSSCEHPEKAMQVLNLLYSDPVVMNLLLNGIEGVHYQYLDADRKVIGFPDGVDAETSRYTQSNGWKLPNQFLTAVWEGNSPELWDEIREYNRDSIKSRAFGFLFDEEKVEAEYAACIEVQGKYAAPLESGRLNPDVYLPKLRQEMKEAGIDAVVAEKQRQLDEWLAQKEGFGE